MNDMNELIEKTNEILEEESRNLSEEGIGLQMGVRSIAEHVYRVKESIENLEGKLEYNLRGKGSVDNDGNPYLSGSQKKQALAFEKDVKALNKKRDAFAAEVTSLKKKAQAVDKFTRT